MIIDKIFFKCKYGKFYITYVDQAETILLIEKDNGEAMQIPVEKFEKCIQEFWTKEF